ncbi:hypothetical protein Bca4012_057932 [Brassica carinata]|uniref:BZIP domain-containing protein n=1 Tax=Brassica carinata TaxID=52824 RepID=A0A8X7PMR6_BRACI|nr:hypothetical protein Bca52824_084481 [Brassica carinata]
MMNKPEMRSSMTGYWSPVLTTSLPNSGSESDLLQQRDLMNERRRKRLESNRESARRSRMKKREHLDDLKAQLAQLRKANRQTAAELTVTTEHYVKIDAENSVMRARVTELNHRLSSLNQIIAFAESYSSAAGGFGMETVHSAAGGFGTKTGHSSAGGLGMKTGHSAAGGFGIETDPSAAGGFGMETDHSAAGGFEMETGHSVVGGFGMETGQGGVTDYGGGGSGGGGGGYYDGAMNTLNLGFYDQPPNMASASTGVGDVPNCW